MKHVAWIETGLLVSMSMAPAQTTPPTQQVKLQTDAAKKVAPKPKPSDAARAAMTAARETETPVKGAEGPARMSALQTSAEAWDKLAKDFSSEPLVASQASFRGGELWQRHGSLAQAEQDFLAAARTDTPRYGQRGLFEAAEMQRRLKRNDDALATYAQVVAIDSASTRAYEARISQGRWLESLGRFDESIGAFRKAVDGAAKSRQVVEAANLLAKVLIQKGDFESADGVLAHAEESVHKTIAVDAAQTESLQKLLDGMSARKSLQRARDKQNGAAKDAKALEEAKGASGN